VTSVMILLGSGLPKKAYSIVPRMDE